MIEVIHELPDNVVGIVAKGRVTNEECDIVLKPAMERSLKRHAKIRLYYEVGSRFPGAGWDDLDLATTGHVYAADGGLSGMFIWDLRDYPLIPGFQGGSIKDRLPRVRIIEGLIQKGLFTYAGAPKPAVRTVARVFRGLPAG